MCLVLRNARVGHLQNDCDESVHDSLGSDPYIVLGNIVLSSTGNGIMVLDYTNSMRDRGLLGLQHFINLIGCFSLLKSNR